MSDTSANPAEATASSDHVTPAADEVTTMLTELGVATDIIPKIKELGVTSVDDLPMLTESDLVGIGMKPIPARNLVGNLKRPASVHDISAVSIVTALPTVPNFTSLLDMLKAGGVLKFEPSSVIAAVQASIADKVGLFGLPDKLAAALLEFAETNGEPVDKSYWSLKTQLTRRNYGDLFAAIEGFSGRNVTEASKKKLFAGINHNLWPAVIAFNDVLSNWMDGWQKSGSNMNLILPAIAQMVAGGGTGVMPPVLNQVPDTGVVRDQADSFNDSVNRAFAGEGLQIAAAVASDAEQIKNALSDPRLPSLVGAANYEQMLKKLGVSVSAADPRFETNVTQFVLAIMQIKNVAGGNEELNYFTQLYMLGSQIPWDQLGAGGHKISGIGGSRL